MAYIDLLTPAQDALVLALKPLITDPGMPAGLQIFQHVPENTQPPYIAVGDMDVDNLSALPGEQEEEVTVEILTVWRADRRRELLAMMHGVRASLHNQPIAADGAHFTRPDYLSGGAGSPINDGVTYLGIQKFKFIAQPA